MYNNTHVEYSAKIVSIAPTDLNNTPVDQPSITAKVKGSLPSKRKTFGKEVYTNLPGLLHDACGQLLEGSDKGVFLAGAIGVVSGILPNIQGRYFGEEVKPHLYCYVLGSYGTGKGGLKHARRLGEAIHSSLQEQEKQAKINFKKDYSRYKKELKEYEQGNVFEVPEEPTPPAVQKLFIPANISNPGMKQILHENAGRGILFESEGDTLANTLKMDYGNYSDDLRKAFHHEPISFFRRTNKEDVEINSPCLAVVVSSTFDQLMRLIPNIENGLFSRFCYFEIEGDPTFKNPFDKRANNHTQYFRELGESFLKVYQNLLSRPAPIWFELTEQQEAVFCDLFQRWKNEIREYVSEDLEGTVNRLGLICFRVCMVLSALRTLEQNPYAQNITCTNQDFDNALRIVDVFRWHAISVYSRIPKPSSYNNAALDKAENEVELRRRCIEMHKNGASYREIAIQVLGSETKKGTAHRYVNGH